MAVPLATLSPNIFTGFGDGLLRPGGKVFFYAAGTTTKLDTYTTALGTTPNTNPVILDADGQAPIFLGPFSYKMVFAPSTDTDPPSSPYWTLDNVNANGNNNVEVIGVAGDSGAAGNWYYLSEGLLGTTAGRWYRTNTANPQSSFEARVIGVATSTPTAGQPLSIRISGRYEGAAGLTVGSEYFLNGVGTLSTTRLSGGYPVAVADSTTSYLLRNVVYGQAASDVFAGAVSLDQQTLGQGLKSVQRGLSTGTLKLGGLASQDITTSTSLAVGTALKTIVMPASATDSIGLTFPGVKICAWGVFAANANAKRVTILFGPTTIADSGSFAFNNIPWRITAYIWVSPATGNQSAVGFFEVGTPVAGFNNTQINSTPAQPVTNAITLTLGQASVANGDISCFGIWTEQIGA